MLVEVLLIVPESIHPQPVLDGVCSGDLGLAKSAKEQFIDGSTMSHSFQVTVSSFCS